MNLCPFGEPGPLRHFDRRHERCRKNLCHVVRVDQFLTPTRRVAINAKYSTLTLVELPHANRDGIEDEGLGESGLVRADLKEPAYRNAAVVG